MTTVLLFLHAVAGLLMAACLTLFRRHEHRHRPWISLLAWLTACAAVSLPVRILSGQIREVDAGSVLLLWVLLAAVAVRRGNLGQLFNRRGSCRS
ncbi:phage holin family protein [Laribacter hongkongensis]|uniref:phage holin family protein n=1 Tax=Laribacter hongkongensis TaxID=168471 RepID=UPI001EFDE6E7|nr:phage holin family protein [Laribacter hongkongensis]MCG9106295.1 phage holin family protein [Laribacter hongkongensis]